MLQNSRYFSPTCGDEARMVHLPLLIYRVISGQKLPTSRGFTVKDTPTQPPPRCGGGDFNSSPFPALWGRGRYCALATFYSLHNERRKNTNFSRIRG